MANFAPAAEKNQMKAAFATWNNRIAPLFDVSRQAFLVEIKEKNILSRQLIAFDDQAAVRKVLRLVEWEVTVLVCGAISQPVASLFAAQAIEVIDYVSGEVDEVIDAWRRGRLDDPSFAMPGCHGRMRRERPQHGA